MGISTTWRAFTFLCACFFQLDCRQANIDPNYLQWENRTVDAERERPVVLNDVASLTLEIFLAVGDHDTVARSEDSGVTWEIANSGIGGRVHLTWHGVSFANSSLGWLVGSHGTILRTVDGGAVWTPQQSGVPDDVTLLGVHALDEEVVCAVGERGTVRCTEDAGATWNDRRGGYYPQASLLPITSPQADYFEQDLHSVHLQSRSSGFAVGSGGLLLYTRNLVGGNWTPAVHALDDVEYLYAGPVRAGRGTHTLRK
ncbi:hypothetical protein CYMTET_6174, partial [Cymbomonas tetramitiformis]